MLDNYKRVLYQIDLGKNKWL